MNANGIFDRGRSTCTIHECGIHVVDRTFAIAAQAKGIGHVTTAVLPQIEGMFTLMRMLWIAVRNNHFSEGNAPEDGTFDTFVVECDVGEHDAFAVVEADVD